MVPTGDHVHVFGLPPEPWPDIPDGFAFGDEFEPPGTIYVFDELSALQRFDEHGTFWDRLLHRLTGLRRLVDGSGQWEVPLRYVRAQVHAKLGTEEDLIHSLALRHQGSDSITIAPADLTALGTSLAAKFVTYMASAAGAFFAPELVYDEVRLSYLEQTEGTAKDGSGGNQHTLIPTITVPFANECKGTSGAAALPYEVACALTLLTDWRGPSYRGRTYMGGLALNAIGTAGKFSTACLNAVGSHFGDNIVQPIFTEGIWQFQVVSRRNASSRAVAGIQVGSVPDSQRRRRANQDEAKSLQWGAMPTDVPH